MIDDSRIGPVKSDAPVTNVNVNINRRGRRSRWQFGSMQIGDRFAVNIEGLSEEEVTKAVRGLRSASCQYAKRHRIKLIVVHDKEEGTLECWRTK